MSCAFTEEIREIRGNRISDKGRYCGSDSTVARDEKEIQSHIYQRPRQASLNLDLGLSFMNELRASNNPQEYERASPDMDCENACRREIRSTEDEQYQIFSKKRSSEWRLQTQESPPRYKTFAGDDNTAPDWRQDVLRGAASRWS